MLFRIGSAVAATASMLIVTSAQSQESPVSPEKAPTTTEIVTGGADVLTSIPSAMTSSTGYLNIIR
jgi:hypothetical protein